ASMSVFAPGWNNAAFVYFDTSSVVSNTPNAPAPLACGWRSGTFSRLKCAICSRKCTSCSRIGPFGPMVSELRSLMAGAPEPVVEPPLGWLSGLDMACFLLSVAGGEGEAQYIIESARNVTDKPFGFSNRRDRREPRACGLSVCMAPWSGCPDAWHGVSGPEGDS